MSEFICDHDRQLSENYPLSPPILCTKLEDHEASRFALMFPVLSHGNGRIKIRMRCKHHSFYDYPHEFNAWSVKFITKEELVIYQVLNS